jgi:hypothetical protein
MADRQFTCPIPQPAEVPASMRQASINWQRTALRWRDLAERRHAHYLDLYKSGRWTHYYTEDEFRAELGSAIALAERWASIAPRPEELAHLAALERLAAA